MGTLSTPYGYGHWGQTEKDGFIVVDGLAARDTYTLMETDPYPASTVPRM